MEQCQIFCSSKALYTAPVKRDKKAALCSCKSSEHRISCESLVAELDPSILMPHPTELRYLHQWFLTLFINCFPISMVLSQVADGTGAPLSTAVIPSYFYHISFIFLSSFFLLLCERMTEPTHTHTHNTKNQKWCLSHKIRILIILFYMSCEVHCTSVASFNVQRLH